MGELREGNQCNECGMKGTNGRTDGRMDGRTDGWMDGRMDGMAEMSRTGVITGIHPKPRLLVESEC